MRALTFFFRIMQKKSLPEEGLMILQNRTETAMGSMAVITFRVLPAVAFRRDTC